MKRSTTALIIIVIIAVVGIGYYYYSMNQPQKQTPAVTAPDTTAADEAAVRLTVENFGQALKNVNLLSDTVATDMDNNYGDLVQQALLTAWKAEPTKAPGRLVSSPWPDRIDIGNVQRLAVDSYSVDGKVADVTSTDQTNGSVTDTRAITLTVDRTNGQWLISEVSLNAQSTEVAQESGNSGGVSFKYFKSLNATYITTNQWPPVMSINSGNYACAVTASNAAQGDVITQSVISGRIYCIDTKNEGAAGSTYSTYTYTTPKNGKLLAIKFILQYPECGNYSDSESSACSAERKTFNLDSIVDGIVQTASWDTSKDTSDALKLQKCLPSSDTASKATCDGIIGKITSFTTCVMDGLTITDTTPPQCVTSSGKAFKQS